MMLPKKPKLTGQALPTQISNPNPGYGEPLPSQKNGISPIGQPPIRGKQPAVKTGGSPAGLQNAQAVAVGANPLPKIGTVKGEKARTHLAPSNPHAPFKGKAAKMSKASGKKRGAFFGE